MPTYKMESTGAPKKSAKDEKLEKAKKSFRMAMDADAGSAAPGSGRRRAGGASLTLNPSGGSKRARHDRRNRECRSRRCSVRR